MKPHADFACNSKTCKTVKGATVYDLPVNSTRCPVCGSRRIIRLFSAPHISRGIAAQTGKMMERDHVRQQRAKDDAKTAQHNAPMLGVSLQNGIPGALREGMDKMGYKGAAVPWAADPLGKAKPTLGVADPTLGGVKAAGSVRVPLDPTTSRRWKPTPAEVAEARRNT